MCKVLKVSRSCYYNWIIKGCKTIKIDEKLNTLVKEVFFQSRKTYGTRRLKEALIQKYNQIKDIRNFFSDKPDQFLEMNICNGDGWDKLCKFLNLQKPNTKFPHYNKLTRQKNVKLTRVQK